MFAAASITPLLQSPFAIKLHVAAAFGAFVIGLWQFWGRKGTTPHRWLGWTWVGLMAIVAASSFWISHIRTFGAFSLIHVLSIYVLVQLPLAVYAARSGRIHAHKIAMTSMFIGALVIAGAFTFMPGRVMYRMIFGLI